MYTQVNRLALTVGSSAAIEVFFFQDVENSFGEILLYGINASTATSCFATLGEGSQTELLANITAMLESLQITPIEVKQEDLSSVLPTMPEQNNPYYCSQTGTYYLPLFLQIQEKKTTYLSALAIQARWAPEKLCFSVTYSLVGQEKEYVRFSELVKDYVNGVAEDVGQELCNSEVSY